ncbi:MAG: hypothetical protein ACOY94_10760 [Bacillota bacterium]
MRRALAAALMLILVAAGCSRPATPPPAPAAPPPAPAPPAVGQPDQAGKPAPPTPTTPVPPSPPVEKPPEPPPVRLYFAVYYAEEGWGFSHIGETTLSGTEGVVPTGSFALSIELAEKMAAGWTNGIEVTGAAAEVQSATDRHVIISLKAGEPGSEVLVKLPPIGGQPETTYRLVRAELPRAEVAVRIDGKWTPVVGGSVYPPRADAIRLSFDRAMDRESVERRIRNPKPPVFSPPLTLENARLEWVDDKTLVLHLEKAPPVVGFYLRGAESADRLLLPGQLPVIRFGELPRLVRVDLGSDKEVEITPLPPDPSGVQLSRDGSAALVNATIWETGPRGARWVRWRIETRTGKREELPHDWRTFVWLGPDGALRSLMTEGKRLNDLALSPDGTRLAAVRSDDYARYDSSDYRFPFDLLILSLEGEVLQTIEDFAWKLLPPKDGVEMHFNLVWSPDGKRIAAQSDDREGGAIAVADLTTGKVRHVRGLPEEVSLPTRYRLAFNGELFLLGRTLLNEKGEVLRELPHGTFSPDGRWILFSRSGADYFNPPWGEVGVVEVKSGETRMLGEGLPAGWTPDGQALIIRWADWEHRYIQVSMI